MSVHIDTPDFDNTPSDGGEFENVDYSILKTVMGKLIPISNGEGILGLEVLDGPYKGVTFSFTKFDILPYRSRNGMVPTKFETKVYEHPEGFVPDEAWDRYTAELFIAWLLYIQKVDVRGLVDLPTVGGIH